MNRKPLALAFVLLSALGLARPAHAGGSDYAVGWERLTGDFGSDDKNRLQQAYLQAEFGNGGTRLFMRMPYVWIDRTGNVTFTPAGPIILGAGGRGRPSWQTSGAGNSEEDIGDLYLRNETLILPSGQGKHPALAFVVDLKWPTANEKKGLGTGEYDYGAGLNFVQPMTRASQFLAEASYTFMGSPEHVDFNNRFRLMLGLGFVTKHTTWRITVEDISPVLEQVPIYDATGLAIGLQDVQDYRLARGDFTLQTKDGGSVRLYVLMGLTDASPDIGFGVILATRPQ